jgi:ATP-dependent DNA helicase DinG
MFVGEDLFSEHGPLKDLFEIYENRPGQRAMAEAVASALQKGEHLAVEAGTGVGKSLAYLLPAVSWALEKGKKILISTSSIALQEQLVNKDLPKIKQIFGDRVHWILARGRNNYVSRRRARRFLETAPLLFEKTESLFLENWLSETTTGFLKELPSNLSSETRHRIVSDRDHCLGKRCPDVAACFFYQARKALSRANIIVVNHALFFSHLALGKDGFLPSCDLLVFDEAHHMEHVAREHLGLRLRESDFMRLADFLGGTKNQGGFLASWGLDKHVALSDLKRSAQKFFRQVSALLHEKDVLRLKSPLSLTNILAFPLSELIRLMNLALEEEEIEEKRLELQMQIRKTENLQKDLSAFMALEENDFVYWVEKEKKHPVLISLPLQVGSLLNEKLFSVSKNLCILTSATLFQQDSFDYTREKIGFEGRALQVPSPFDFSQQMDLVFDNRLQDPQSQTYLSQLLLNLKDHLEEALPGGVLILFTSFRILKDSSRQLAPWLEGKGRRVLVQTKGGDDRKLLRNFSKEKTAVLFGTDRYWTGIDIPGSALQTLIIVKMPFARPDHPLKEAYCEFLEAQGRNPFKDCLLPETILKLRQGMGRLIRRQEDRGRVVILDGRLFKKSYGKIIRRNLPHEGRLWSS